MSISLLASTGYNWGDIITISASDTVNIIDDTTNNPRKYPMAWLYVLTTGNFSITDVNGVSRVITGVAANTIIPFPVKRVNNTNTTGTAIGLITK